MQTIDLSEFNKKIKLMADGAYDVLYENRRYLCRKETHLKGRLIKLYAEELGGNNFISLNYYIEKKLLKPCEMPIKKVVKFICELDIIWHE